MKSTVRANCFFSLSVILLSLLVGVSSFSQHERASAHRVSVGEPAHVQQIDQARQTTHVQQARVPHVQRAAHARHKTYRGKVIVVSLSQQWLTAYQDGQPVFSTAVLTGRPSLPTPRGTYHIFQKLSPTTFRSPWPRSSPNWYPPTHINYAMEWKAGGYYLHDSWWHTVYGAGTNEEHYDPTYGWQQGSHGCISMPLSAAKWLYQWAPIGTTVKVIA